MGQLALLLRGINAGLYRALPKKARPADLLGYSTDEVPETSRSGSSETVRVLPTGPIAATGLPSTVISSPPALPVRKVSPARSGTRSVSPDLRTRICRTD